MKNRIRELRKSKRLTTVELANIAEISQSYLSELEQGLKTPTIPIARRIAKALGCELNDVFPEEYEHSKV
ncbi:helix-turn-helix transcriptional regulator [Marinitoga lauensis]|uniref:helix-turn-helix transcriptional regulator n=1 Tax=Marinitoga lauensis TaxID=2201189 RepID=UPI0010131C6A|nr:helix-turn-helix transcriptional regulator [Marinitoga lauensis]